MMDEFDATNDEPESSGDSKPQVESKSDHEDKMEKPAPRLLVFFCLLYVQCTMYLLILAIKCLGVAESDNSNSESDAKLEAEHRVATSKVRSILCRFMLLIAHIAVHIIFLPMFLFIINYFIYN